MNAIERKKWIRKYGDSDTTHERVIFLPHAGGSANFFHELCVDLSSSIECIAIQYPGRQDRFDEKMINSIEEYSDIITEVILGLDDKPTMLFGHSMGSLIAYNMLVRYESELPFINLLLASAHNPPQNNPKYVDYDSMSNDNIIAYLKRLGGFDDVLLSDPNIIEIILPAVRNDLQAVSKYSNKSDVKINVPILAIIGDQDRSTDIESTSVWSELTTKEFQIIQLPGGHFYLSNEYKSLKKIILQAFDIKIRAYSSSDEKL
ncbi:alpha/beta fold hydrolase [Peribacillus frigoritolerans]|uniref:thioesterase II family protein n=1 Tax=Peribacillus frigoritolerans TaxID=450367 RepID=UPI0022264A04|nr:alpha/beta fold hydrolase [Peribacillus frigoritolerans]UYY98649.1 alpha/beta fold hydrolase [Peribacillus frigoritolerans]